jgi:hypothetical protein
LIQFSLIGSQFSSFIRAVLRTLLPKFEAAGIAKLMSRSMQPRVKSAVDGVMAALAGGSRIHGQTGCLSS